MTEMREQQAKREEELKQILVEKEKEIEKLRESEADKSQVTGALKQMFQDERASANADMKEFLKTFQQQKEETAQRLAGLTPQDRAELEEQKAEAKNTHDAAEAKIQSEKTIDNPIAKVEQ